MRRSLEAIALAAFAIMIWITWSAVYGPDRLHGPIPTHFNVSGNPDHWGDPGSLLLLPAVTLALYLAISLVAAFPAAFSYPVRVTAENRPRLQALALKMVACLKVELVCLFTWIQWAIIETVRQGRGSLPAALVPVGIGTVFATILGFIVAIVRAGPARKTG
jgi:uncharacterized membrane protein